MPQIDDVVDCPGGNNRAATELFHLPIVTASFDKCPRPCLIAIGRLVRQLHGDAEPGAVEIDQRAILVEQDAADISGMSRRLPSGFQRAGPGVFGPFLPSNFIRSSPRRV